MNKISYSCLRLKQLFHVSLHEAMCNRLPGAADRAIKDGEITAGTNWNYGRLDSLHLFIYLSVSGEGREVSLSVQNI